MNVQNIPKPHKIIKTPPKRPQYPLKLLKWPKYLESSKICKITLKSLKMTKIPPN